MDPTHSEPQVPEQQWLEPPIPTKNDKFLEQRIEELEQQVAAYDALLNKLPDLFFLPFALVFIEIDFSQSLGVGSYLHILIFLNILQCLF